MENTQLQGIVKKLGLTPDAKKSRATINDLSTEEFVLSNEFRTLLNSGSADPKAFTALTGLTSKDLKTLTEYRRTVAIDVGRKKGNRLSPEGTLLGSPEEATAARQQLKAAGAERMKELQIPQFDLPTMAEYGGRAFLSDMTASKLKAKGYDPSLAYMHAYNPDNYGAQLAGEIARTAKNAFPETAGSIAPMGIGGGAADIVSGALTQGVTNLSPAWLRAIAGAGRFALHLTGAIAGGHYGSEATKAIQQKLESGNLTDEERGLGDQLFGPQTPGGQIASNAATLSFFKPTLSLAGAPLKRLIPELLQNPSSISRNPMIAASVKDIGTRGYFVFKAAQTADQINEDAIARATKDFGYVPSQSVLETQYGYKSAYQKLSDMGMAALLGKSTKFGEILGKLGHLDTTEKPEYNADKLATDIANMRKARESGSEFRGAPLGESRRTAGSFPRFDIIEGGVRQTVEDRGEGADVFPTRKESSDVVTKFNASFGHNANEAVPFVSTPDGNLKLVGMTHDNDYTAIERGPDGKVTLKSFGWNELPDALKQQAADFFGSETFIDHSDPRKVAYKFDPAAESEDVPGRASRTYHTENDLRGVPTKDANGKLKKDIYILTKDGVDIPVRAVSMVDNKNTVGVKTFSGNYYRVPKEALRDGEGKPLTTIKTSSWPERAYQKSYRPSDAVGEAIRFQDTDWRLSPDAKESVKTGDEESWKNDYDLDYLRYSVEGIDEYINSAKEAPRGQLYADKYSGNRVVKLQDVDVTIDGKRMVGMVVYDLDSRVHEPYVTSYMDLTNVADAEAIKARVKAESDTAKEETDTEEEDTDTEEEDGKDTEEEDGKDTEEEDGKDTEEEDGKDTEEEDGKDTEEEDGKDTEGEDIVTPSPDESGVGFIKQQIVRHMFDKGPSSTGIPFKELTTQDWTPRTFTQIKEGATSQTEGKFNRDVLNQALSELAEDGVISYDAMDPETTRVINKGEKFNEFTEKRTPGQKTPAEHEYSFGEEFKSKERNPSETLPSSSTGTHKATADREPGHEWHRATAGETVRTTPYLTDQEIKSVIKAYSYQVARPKVYTVEMRYATADNETLARALEVEGVSNEEDVVRVMQTRWDTTPEQARAIAKYVELWATGFATSVARYEGININKRLMARMTPEEKYKNQFKYVKKQIIKLIHDGELDHTFLLDAIDMLPSKELQAVEFAVNDLKHLDKSFNYMSDWTDAVKLLTRVGPDVAPTLHEAVNKLVRTAIEDNGKVKVKNKTFNLSTSETFANYDTWKKDFREITIFNNTKANKQLLADLKQLYYEQYLGSFGNMSLGDAWLYRPTSKVAYVGRAMSMIDTATGQVMKDFGNFGIIESNSGLETKIHELHHMLLKSLPRVFINELLDDMLPGYSMKSRYGQVGEITGRIINEAVAANGQDAFAWNRFHDEELTQILTNAITTSDRTGMPYRYQMGTDAFDYEAKDAIVNLGRLMRLQMEVIDKQSRGLELTDEEKEILGDGYKDPNIPKRNEYNLGGVYGAGSPSGIGKDIHNGLLSGKFTSLERAIPQVIRVGVRVTQKSQTASENRQQFRVIKITPYNNADKNDPRKWSITLKPEGGGSEATITFADLLGKKMLTALIDAKKISEISQVDLDKFSTDGVQIAKFGRTQAINEAASATMAQMFGHYQSFINKELRDVAPITPSNLTDGTATAYQGSANLTPTIGRRWFGSVDKVQADYAARTKGWATTNASGEISEKRILHRLTSSYLGWLDIGGYSNWLQGLYNSSSIWNVPQVAGNGPLSESSVSRLTLAHEGLLDPSKKHLFEKEPLRLFVDNLNKLDNDYKAAKNGTSTVSSEIGTGTTEGEAEGESGESKDSGGTPFDYLLESPGIDVSDAPESESETEKDVPSKYTVDGQRVTIDDEMFKQYAQKTDAKLGYMRPYWHTAMEALAVNGDAHVKDGLSYYLTPNMSEADIRQSLTEGLRKYLTTLDSDATEVNFINELLNGDKKDAIINEFIKVVSGVEPSAERANTYAADRARKEALALEKQRVADSNKRLVDTLKTRVQQEIEDLMLGEEDVVPYDEMTLSQKQDLFAKIKPQLVDYFKSLVADPTVEFVQQQQTFIDDVINSQLALHTPTEAEIVQAQQIREARNEAQKAAQYQDNKEFYAESQRFFENQVSDAMAKISADRVGVARGGRDTFLSVIRNNIIGTYLNNWVLQSYRTRIPGATYLYYTRYKHIRALRYAAGKSDVHGLTSDLFRSKQTVGLWPSQESNIKRVTNQQYRDVEKMRTAWRALFRDIGPASLWHDGMTDQKRITLFNTQYENNMRFGFKTSWDIQRTPEFLEKYKLGDEYKNRTKQLPGKVVADVNSETYKKAFGIQTIPDNMKERLAVFTQEYDRLRLETSVDLVMEDLGKKKELRAGLSAIEVEIHDLHHTLDPAKSSKKTVYVSNFTTMADAVKSIEQQNLLITTAVDSWDPFNEKTSEFKRDFMHHVENAVYDRVRTFMLNTQVKGTGRNAMYKYETYDSANGLQSTEWMDGTTYSSHISSLMKTTARSASAHFFNTYDSSFHRTRDITDQVRDTRRDLEQDTAFVNAGLSESEYQNETFRRLAIYELARTMTSHTQVNEFAQRQVDDLTAASIEAGNVLGNDGWNEFTFYGQTYKTKEQFVNALHALSSNGHRYVSITDAIEHALELRTVHDQQIEQLKNKAKQLGIVDATSEFKPFEFNGRRYRNYAEYASDVNAIPAVDHYGFSDITTSQLRQILQVAQMAEKSGNLLTFRSFIRANVFARKIPGLVFASGVNDLQLSHQPSMWKVGENNANKLMMLGLDVIDVDNLVQKKQAIYNKKVRESAIHNRAELTMTKDDESFEVEQGFSFDYIEALEEEKSLILDNFKLHQLINTKNIDILTEGFQESLLHTLAGRPFVYKPGTKETLTLDETRNLQNTYRRQVSDLNAMIKASSGQDRIALEQQKADVVKMHAELNQSVDGAFAKIREVNAERLGSIGRKISQLMYSIDGTTAELKTDAEKKSAAQMTGLMYGEVKKLLQNIADGEFDDPKFIISKLSAYNTIKDVRTKIIASFITGYPESVILRNLLNRIDAASDKTLGDFYSEDESVSLKDLLYGLAIAKVRSNETAYNFDSRSETTEFFNKVKVQHDAFMKLFSKNDKLEFDLPFNQVSKEELAKIKRFIVGEVQSTEYLLNEINDRFNRDDYQSATVTTRYVELIKDVTPLENMVLETKRQHMLMHGLSVLEGFVGHVSQVTGRGTTNVNNAIKQARIKQDAVEARHMVAYAAKAAEENDVSYRFVQRRMNSVMTHVENMELAFDFLSKAVTKSNGSTSPYVLKVTTRVVDHGEYISFVLPKDMLSNATGMSSSLRNVAGTRILVPKEWYSTTTGSVTFKSGHSFIPSHLSALEKQAFVLTNWFVENETVAGIPVGNAFTENVSDYLKMQKTHKGIDLKNATIKYTNDVLNSLVMKVPLYSTRLKYTNTGKVTLVADSSNELNVKLESWSATREVNQFRYNTSARNINYGALRLSVEEHVGQPITYLSNEQLWTLTNGQGETLNNRFLRFRELVKARDEYTINPLEAHIKEANKVLTDMSLTDLNETLQGLSWTYAERAAFFNDYWHVTQTREGNIAREYMMATGKFPEPSDIEYVVKRLNPNASEKQLADLIEKQLNAVNALEEMLAKSGYETAVKQSQATQVEIQFANSQRQNMQMVGLVRNINAEDLDAEQSQIRQTLLRQTDLLTGNSNSVFEQLLNETGGRKDEAIELVNTLFGKDAPLVFEKIDDILKTGVNPPGYKNIKSQTLTGKAAADLIEQSQVSSTDVDRLLRHAQERSVQGLSTVQTAMKTLPVALTISKALTKIGVRSGRGRTSLSDLVDAASTMKPNVSMTKEQSAQVTDIQQAVVDYVKSTTKAIVGARAELVKSMNDPSFLTYDYKQVGNKVEVRDGSELKYIIDYKAGTVETVTGQRVLSAGSKPERNEYIAMLHAHNVDTSFSEIYQSLDARQLKMVDLLVKIARNPGEKYIGGNAQTHGDAVRQFIETARQLNAAVPAVYWHGITKMERPVKVEGQTPEDMYHEPLSSPEMVEMEYGSISEGDQSSFVKPVINRWLNPESGLPRRVVMNNSGFPARNAYGFEVYTDENHRSHIYRNLASSGLHPNKALEVYALMEHPEFKSWATETVLDNLESKSPGTSLTTQARVNVNDFKAQRVFDAIKLHATMMLHNVTPTDSTYEQAKQLYGETLGSHLTDVQLDRAFAKYTDNGKDMAPLAMEISKYIDHFTTPDIQASVEVFRHHVKSEQQVVTGSPFTTLAFAPDVDGGAYASGNGIQVHDLFTGLHERSGQRKNARFIKMENPLVVDAGDNGLSESFLRGAMEQAKKGKHDGIVIKNVVQNAFSPQTTAIAYTFNDANVRTAKNMLGREKDSITKASSKDIEAFLPTMDEGDFEPMMSPIMYQGTEPAPALPVAGARIPAPVPTKVKVIEAFDQLEKEWQGVTRLSLAMDLAYPFIQGGKFGYGVFTGRPQDSLIWLNALKSSLRGFAPRLAFTDKNGNQQGAHIGRREYIKLFLQTKNDPYYEVMKELGVPLNFYNYERAITKARERKYLKDAGKTNWNDVYVDLMQISEVGHVQQDMVKDAMVNKLPIAGMAERFTSLNHDLLMFNLVKWQLVNNPLLSKVPLNKLKYERSAKEVANFIALSLGDFQYSTNEDADMRWGRAAKWVAVAPRWMLANWLMKPHWNYVLSQSETARKLLGENNRVFNAMTTRDRNPDLLKYQYKTIYGSMVFTWAVSQAIHMLGLLFKRDDIKGESMFSGKAGAFRVGNWMYSDSSGVWDDINKMAKVMDSFNKTIHRTNKVGDNAQENWMVSTADKLGYNVSPAVMKLIFDPMSGKDVINRSVYATDPEWDYVMQHKLRPWLKVIPEGLAPSNYVSSFFPTALNEVVDTAYESRHKDSQLAATLTQAIVSEAGTRWQYDEYIPKQQIAIEKIKKQHERNWQYSPSLKGVIDRSLYDNKNNKGKTVMDVLLKTSTGRNW